MNETDAFWNELRERVSATDEALPPTLEEADRRMETAGEEPLSAAQIAAIVRRATSLDPRGETEADAPAVRPRGFARAAAMLTGSVLLSKTALVASATVGIVAAVLLWPEGRNAKWTLEYQNAIEILVDPAETADRRASAQFRVFSEVSDGIEVLLEVRDWGGDLGERAKATLADLREQLDAPDPIRPLIGDASPSELAMLVLDPAHQASERLGFLESMDEQLHYGVLTLLEVRSASGPPGLLQEVGIALEYVRDALAR